MARTEQHPTVNIYNERIISDPRVCGGQPIVKGTRIPVELVLEQLALNLDLKELLADYPRLAIEDVKACLAFARSLVEREGPVKPAVPATATRPPR